MTDEDSKTINRMYATGEIPKTRNRQHKNGQSKYASQTTWGPPRRKGKRVGESGSLVNTVAFPNTKRIAVDRVAAAESKPCIYVIEDDVRASRVQIKCPDCDKIVAEVRWSGVTTDAPTVWIEVGTHVPLKVFTDVGDR